MFGSTFAFAALALSAPPATVPPAPPMTATAPDDPRVSDEHQPAALDRLLAAHDYTGLVARVGGVRRQADAVADLNWLKARLVEGNSAFVAMLYSRLLWVASAEMPDQPKSELRQTALMAAAYALAAIRVDGTRCGDRTAPGRRIDQLMTEWNPEIWRYPATLTAEQRANVVKVALAIEARTASRRAAIGDVDFLCRAGMEETTYNLAHGTRKEVPTAPGRIGRTIELTGDGRYVPSQRPEAEWRKDSEAARDRLPTDLARLLEGLSGPAAVPAPPAPPATPRK
jgi:hypothetical protein